MIPLSDLISRVRTKHEHATSVRWTDADIQKVINEGLECLAEATHFYERYITVPIQMSRTWYDLRGFTPEVVVSIKSIHSSTRNYWLKPISVRDLPYNWEQSVGEPQCFFTRGCHWYGVWPRAGSDESSGFHRVYFAGIPQRFENTQAVLRDLPDNHVIALEDYALYELAAQDREWKRAQQLFQSYRKREKDLADFIDGRRNPSTAGAMYSHQRYSL